MLTFLSRDRDRPAFQGSTVPKFFNLRCLKTPLECKNAIECLVALKERSTHWNAGWTQGARCPKERGREVNGHGTKMLTSLYLY
jgi:hypothetical protein